MALDSEMVPHFDHEKLDNLPTRIEVSELGCPIFG
jgi:hypothetical protein